VIARLLEEKWGDCRLCWILEGALSMWIKLGGVAG
jgi:hypothetical protein